MNTETRRPAAGFAIAILAAIVAFCPVLMCAPQSLDPAAHSCCPRTHRKPGRLPCDATSQSCPYSLLEKARFVPLPLAIMPPAVTAMAAPMVRHEPIGMAPSDVAPAKDLYLRNRVLLL